MKKYKIRINKEKLEILKSQLAPSKSYWALVGIVFFFFIPEIVAFFWGKEIKQYFNNLLQTSSNSIECYLFKLLKSLGDISFLNIVLGIIFLIWFFKNRK